MNKMTNCLWFDGQAEEAAQFYTSVIKNSKITRTAYFPNAGTEIHGRAAGSVMTVEFELNGNCFMGLNGGPYFKFNEAISFVLHCESQDEIDYYTQHLSSSKDAEQCGWVKDRFGLSWQIVPSILPELMVDPERAERVMAAVMQMKKIDIQTLLNA